MNCDLIIGMKLLSLAVPALAIWGTMLGCGEAIAQDSMGLTKKGLRFRMMPNNKSLYLYFLSEDSIILGTTVNLPGVSGDHGTVYGKGRAKCSHDKARLTDVERCGTYELNGNQVVMHDTTTAKWFDGSVDRTTKESGTLRVTIDGTSCSGDLMWSGVSYTIVSCVLVKGRPF